MPRIAVSASDEASARRYLEAVEKQGGEPLLLMPGSPPASDEVLAQIQGLLLTGGADVEPALYGERADPVAQVESNPARDALDFPLLRAALTRDLPVLAVCRGMQVLNVALGGKLIQDLPGHRAEQEDGRWVSAYHRIWIAPGSKLAAVLGSGGLVRVNSRHHQGMREAQKAPLLIASAYTPDDFLVEGVESPFHTWVIGVQCHPERAEEVPRQFQRLFQVLVEKAARRIGSTV
ncbi:MAG: gamma-glutamyl-gamma-aminobutyrate hydrolase family protein [Chloroflexi bacterium]|nr:gamma-glutamyl-gamma-aminobutyrate hydrolase family protein [Chloroflexota bacterium]